MQKVKSMKDIAKIAGVSEGTVSRALKNSSLISTEVKEKIQKIAKDHHYSPNRNAANLSTKKSNAVVVVVNQDLRAESFSGQPFILSMLGLLADELAKKHMEMILSPDRTITGCWNNHFIRSKRADGIIILGPGPDAGLFDELTDHNVPFVVWGGKEATQQHCVVAGDNVKGGFLVAKHLQEAANRKRILLLGPRYTLEGGLRYQGYKNALRENGNEVVEELLVDCEWSSESAFDVINDILKTNSVKFDAVFALSDVIAFGVIKAIQANGLQVPGDISVVGYDDIPSSKLISPSLTSVHQDSTDAAKLMVECILDLIDGKAVESATLTTDLIVRESSAVS